MVTGIPFFQGNAEFGMKYPTPRLYTRKPLQVAEKGDILLSVRAPVGDVNINTSHACIGRGVAAFRAPKIEGVYLYYYFRNNKRHFEKMQQGSTFKAINSSDLKEMGILVPPPREQQKIASILTTVDENIEETDKIIEKCRVIEKGMIQRYTYDNPNATKIILKTLLNPQFRSVPKPPDCYLGLGIRSHGKGTFLKPDSDPAKIDMDTLYRVKTEDLIVNITFAWEGAIAIAKEEDDGALVSHRFPTYVIDKTKALPEFIQYVIVQRKFIHALWLISPGGAGRNRVLNKTDFLKLTMPLPPLNEQKKIIQDVSAVQKRILLEENKKQQLEYMKQALMQKLLTGELRVTGD